MAKVPCQSPGSLGYSLPPKLKFGVGRGIAQTGRTIEKPGIAWLWWLFLSFILSLISELEDILKYLSSLVWAVSL